MRLQSVSNSVLQSCWSTTCCCVYWHLQHSVHHKGNKWIMSQILNSRKWKFSRKASTTSIPVQGEFWLNYTINIKWENLQVKVNCQWVIAIRMLKMMTLIEHDRNKQIKHSIYYNIIFFFLLQVVLIFLCLEGHCDILLTSAYPQEEFPQHRAAVGGD